ncbi:putative bifunctional diguanylate cyclase/phosphodiesterase [Aurantiacibacter gilvus]|uniref:EAL domain-containing protein n=1 Tax=Aurantiacibacter gilvus TaxID=3139141 RepID=A0ABU9IFG7_9SPHN
MSRDHCLHFEKTLPEPNLIIDELRIHDTRWITATVAILSIIVFVISGSQIMPAILVTDSIDAEPSGAELSAFLLNIALIIFAWKRSNELVSSFAELDAWQNRAISLAYQDDMTGLCNRRYLTEAFELLQSSRNSLPILILIDLDRFKQVNDLFGHKAGDQVLAFAATMIRQLCPTNSICVRLGGDEFAILLYDKDADMRVAKRLAWQIVTQLKSPIRLENGEFLIGASIGICGSEAGTRELDELLSNADIAMYAAKALGGNCLVEADHAMVATRSERNTLEAEIRNGLAKREFRPYFQPIVDLASGELMGFEVLARWKHPSRGVLEPSAFMRIATICGLFAEISFSVMEYALKVARAWPDHLRIGINVAQDQFEDPLFVQRVRDALASLDFPANRLDLEIPEICLISDHDQSMSKIQRLKKLEIGIVVDDFGTRYASMMNSDSLPFDRIKIGTKLVEAINEDRATGALVQAVATLGKGLSIPISAAGVETSAMHATLERMGCDNAQGLLFGKALAREEVELQLKMGS